MMSMTAISDFFTKDTPVQVEKRSSASGISDLKNPTSWFQHLLGATPTKSKAVVNRNTAKTIAAVYAAVKNISEAMASMPFSVINEINGDKNIAKNHPVHFLISKEANSLQTAYNFKRQLVYDACMKGDGYAYIKRNRMGQPVSLEYVFDAIPYLREDGTLWYEFTRIFGINGSRSYTDWVTADDMIHIAGLSENGITGIDIILAQRENLGIAITATEYVAAYFGQGTHGGGFIKHPLKLSDGAALRLSQSINKKYGGVDNMGHLPVLDEGMDFVKSGSNPAEAGLIDIRKYQVEDVSRVFTVPLHMLASLDRATFNNIEVMNTGWVNNCLNPWAENIEQEVNRKCFSKNEKTKNLHYTNFDFSRLLKGDTEARAKYFMTMFQIGAMSPNDIRRSENMNDREGGNEYFVPLNFTNNPNSILQDGKGKKSKPAA